MTGTPLAGNSIPNTNVIPRCVYNLQEAVI